MMKSKWIIIFLLCFFSGCDDHKEVKNYKDLEQNMMDVRIYQENLGDQIKAKNLEDASWFLEGMDSILQILNQKFKEHHKLSSPFSYFYKKRMSAPIKGIRSSIRENDTARALESYRILIKRCNDCHADNDIDKEVPF